MTQHWTENSTRLKLLVGVMTTLLVVGLILMVIGIAKTSKELTDQAAQNLGDRTIPLATGDTLINLSADDGRLYLGIRHKDGRQSIKIVDTKTRKVVGQYLLEAKP
jgi:hypothetical protein